MATFPRPTEVPLILRYTEGLSYAEIAEVLSITVPAVKSRLFRARNMLAGRLEEAGRGNERAPSLRPRTHLRAR